MANYYTTTRTNYFHVKDEQEFYALMNAGCEGMKGVDYWNKEDENGNIMFAFGGYSGDNTYVICEDDDECDGGNDGACIHGCLAKKLQPLIADDDACIIITVGNEKLRYVTGTITVVTSKNIEGIFLEYAGVSLARNLLNNPYWNTVMHY